MKKMRALNEKNWKRTATSSLDFEHITENYKSLPASNSRRMKLLKGFTKLEPRFIMNAI